jgi:hypothetical protein
MLNPEKNLLPSYRMISRTIPIPIELVIAHAECESNQYSQAIGRAGEYGLWQFLPSTWISLLGNADWKSVENQTIAYIIHASNIIKTYHLNLYEDNDIIKFLWIWNAGGGNYKKKYMPASTKEYIRKILYLKTQVSNA